MLDGRFVIHLEEIDLALTGLQEKSAVLAAP
jgi:hypothetical protein